jgi:hypothetical protein
MSGPSTYYTAQRIIRMAYQDSGLIQDGDEPSSEQYANGLMRLNDIANLWQTQGLKLWTLQDISIPLVAGQGTYRMGPGYDIDMTKPMRIIEAYYRDPRGIRRPLVVLSWDDYIRLSQINQRGQINSYFVNKQQLYLDVFFWLIPDSTAAQGTAHLLTQKRINNAVSLTEDIMFPIEWSMGLRWGLADDLSTGQPQVIMQRCAQKAQAYREALEDWDVEDAPTSFTPDQRALQTTSGFR